MATCSSLSSVLSAHSVPKFNLTSSKCRVRFPNLTVPSIALSKWEKKKLLTRLNAAGLSDIETDIIEEPRDRWATNSVSMEDFKYGEYDASVWVCVSRRK